mgnify:CR=1 FL=1
MCSSDLRYVLFAAPVARLAGVPIILWYAHGTADRALRLAMPFVDRVVTPTRDSFPLAGPGIDGKVRVTGHGIDVMRHAPGGAVAEPGLVLSAGRLSPVKRHELAIEAVNGGPEGSRLVIAGSPLHAGDVAYRNHLVSKSAFEHSPSPSRRHMPWEEGTPNQVGLISFVGDVAYREMPATYRRAWVLAHASRTGSLDKVVLEAAACGTPVVASDIPPVVEAVGDAAELVTPDNVFDIARGLRSLLSDAARRESLSLAGLKRASTFRWEVTARQVAGIYSELIN